MKKRYLSLWLIVLLGQLVMAQSTNAPLSIGCASKTVGPKDIPGYSLIIGQAIAGSYEPNKQCRLGFPYDAPYVQNTFAGGLLTSKGYYPEYVLLQWSVASNMASITSFTISRRKQADANAAYQVVATLDPTSSSWQDQTCETATLYQYKVSAVGVSGVEAINKTYVEGYGFRQPIGTATGRITYAGGTAVPGVSVVAQTSPALTTSALVFVGVSSYVYNDEKTKGSLTSGTAFTFQAWVKVDGLISNSQYIFNKANVVSLQLTNNIVYFTYKGISTTLSYASMAGTYFHITAEYNGNNVLLQLNDGTKVLQTKKSITGSIGTDKIDGFYIGRNQNATYPNSFKGSMDEIRIWNIALDSATIQRDYDRVLTGTEKGLQAYYQCNEATGSMIYDASHTGNSYNANDASLTNVTWTSNTPSLLKIKGVTDTVGNYQITGIPYAAGGSSYTFTPQLSVHSFNPKQALRYFAAGSTVSNNVDFTDNSSFKVSGRVYYSKTKIPVAGVNVLVDGNMAIKGNKPVTTSDSGTFQIDVPIGFHRITLSKNNHSFADGFPTKDYQNSKGELDSLFDFQNDITTPLYFYDNTLATFTGRVVGGTREQAKPLGFGLSKSNLGNGKVVLNLQTAVSGARLRDNADTITVSGNAKIKSKYILKDNIVTIYPDVATGEYAVLLPPETYTINSAIAGDLVNKNYTFTDNATIKLDINKKDSSIYRFVDSVKVGTKYTYKKDSAKYRYNNRYDFIQRLTPTILVSQDKQAYFGDSMLVFENKNVKLNDTLKLYNKTTKAYYFGYPIFHQKSDFNFNIKVFEKYENYVTGFVDTIPQSSGDTIIINNNLSTNSGTYTDTLNKKGALKYSFVGGDPNITAPYTNAVSFMYKYVKDNIIQQVMAPDITGIVLGGKSSGSNFVTAGPTKIDMILRDPAGSNSYAYLSTGSTVTKSESIDALYINDDEVTAAASFGPSVKVGVGVGVVVESETKTIVDVSLGLKHNLTITNSGTTTSTITNTEQWSTSADAGYVGSMGDVFLGHSTNLVYGKTKNVCIVKDSVGTPQITLGDSYKVSPEFGTSFKYSQNHVKGYLLPNLMAIRANIFKQQPDVYIPVKANNYVNTTSYKSAKGDTIYGDAYIYVPKTQITKSNKTQASDSIKVYSTWIKEWEQVLYDNELAKVNTIAKATSNSTNHSFDAGVSYESTNTSGSSKSKSYTFHTETYAVVTGKAGIEFNSVGVSIEGSVSNGGAYNNETGSQTEMSTTYGYVLAEGNQGSYYSVDVLPATDGFGPVFRTRGGQSYCPYEGQELTKYYEAGKHELNVATEQMEIPQITINNLKTASQINIPANSQAYFTLSLRNLSMANNNVWYDVAIADASNPDGLILKIDGATIGTKGLSYMVPSLQAVTKTLSIAMGKPNVFKYTNVGIVLRSQCQGDPSSDVAVIADTVFVNVEFTPACTKVSLAQLLDQWVMNIDNPNLPVKATDYNMNEGNFQSISLEYKPSSSALWSEADIYYKDTTTSSYKNSKSNKHVLDASFVLSDYIQYLKLDQKYDIRAKTNCADGITAYSNIVSGIKDMKPPHVFGTPQPSNGILSIGQDISVLFDETIEPSKTGVEDVTVSGVLNNSPINHATSLNLDGGSGYAKADGFSFTDQPFTVEFWMQRLDGADTGVIVSRGSTLAEKFEIANTDSGKMQISLGNTTFSAIDPSLCYNVQSPASAWHHYALSFDTSGAVVLYGDDKVLLSKFKVKYSPSERSPLYLGRSVNGNSYGKAYIDEVRVWNTVRTESDINGNKSVLLSGSQQGLVAYWPLSDGTGNLVADRAGSHSLSINTSWEIALENKAISFDATKKQVLFFNGVNLALSNEQDATIEFWFKAPKQSSRACLFSNGVKDTVANEANLLAFGLFIEPSGMLTLTAGGITNNATIANIDDDAWHHFALVIDRLSNVRTYLDGNVQSQLSTSLFQSLNGLQMSIGANHIQVLSDSTVTNQYFTGSIDEFRIWETARKASLINRYKNTKLDGSELGLRYYFPFEGYKTLSGQKIQTIFESLKNNVDSASQIAKKAARTDTVVAKLVNGADYSLQAPAVKDALPKTYLNTSFDINTDKLLVNLPKQDAGLYENCILDISVGYVYDKNGNRISSPVQWTAYVDQNPVVWSNKSQSLSILSGNGASFTVDIVNKSGSTKSYNLNGLPAWLTTNADYGTLQPNSSLTVTFTVNNGLNIGTYSQFINLTTDYGFDEKLQVDVTVKAQAPNWKVTPGNYQYTMNVFGKLQIDGVIATNENTLVAAFVDGECRGVTSLKYLSTFDLSEAMLSIYSNKQSGDSIKLLVWDANTGIIYSNVTPTYTFTADVVVGSPKSPVLITCDNTVQNTLSLNSGWNWISINVANLKSNSVESILGNVGSPSDQIWSQKSVYDQYSSQLGWSGSLDISGLNAESMYKLHLTKAGVATINGKIVDTDSAKVTVVPGWNWIGYVPQFNESVNEALASYSPQDGDLIKSQKAFSMYYKGLGWIGTLSTMEPGKGYMLQAAKASTLVYPKKGLLKSFVDEQGVAAPKIIGYTGGNAKSNATILAQLEKSNIDLTGKVLASYSGTKCIGFALPMTLSMGGNFFFLVADEVSDSSKLTFALVDTTTNEKTVFTNQLTYSSNSVNGRLNNPYLLKSETLSTSTDVQTAFDEGSVYPNPFQNTLHVSGNLNEESIVTIRIIDVLGKEVFNYHTMKAKGAYSIDLNNQSTTSIEKLSSGWYNVEVNTNSGTFHSSVLKQ